MFSEFRFRKKAKRAKMSSKCEARTETCYGCNGFAGHWEGDHFVECHICWGVGEL